MSKDYLGMREEQITKEQYEKERYERDQYTGQSHTEDFAYEMEGLDNGAQLYHRKAYSDNGRQEAGRKKRRKKSLLYTILGLSFCLFLMVAFMYGALVIWERSNSNVVEDTMGDVGIPGETESKTYTREELDSKFDQGLILGAEQKESEILGSIRQRLLEGVSVVETLRSVYPDELVLVSGGKYHFVPINEKLKMNSYEESGLNLLDNGELEYVENGEVVTYKGIDVSKHQGSIDWQKVAADGVEFAFIRVALRGYGTGKLVEDEYFEQNITGALSAGIKVGVYVYSQAINEAELLEEADLVLRKIAPYKVECPVVYDVEMVSGGDGRMNNLSVEERTRLTKLFCETIQNAGYKPMIYHNMEMGALRIQLEELEEYDKWFAYYNKNFYYPYDYKVWQYSDKGIVNGIQGNVDLNISFVPLWEE